MPPHITEKLLSWYEVNKRDLPWKRAADPYAVWVSEVMLQQTRVETVIPYYTRWMQQFPDIFALAEASLQEVLSLWEGLGYYSRARNLHRAAEIVVREHDGVLPANPEALRALPGIGRYTAGAIASFAFGKDEPIVDGNVRRVLSRLFNVEEPVNAASGEHRIWELAAKHLPPDLAGDYNQALMDFGSTVCIPRNPLCPNCVLNGECRAFALGVQNERPVTRRKAVVPHYTVTAAVIRQNGRVLIAQRPQDGLLGGMWEFPGGKQEPGEELADCLRREIGEELGVAIEVGDELGVFQHAYTHFRVTLHAFECNLREGVPRPIGVEDLQWVRPGELSDYPMGKLDRLIAKKLGKQVSLEDTTRGNR